MYRRWLPVVGLGAFYSACWMAVYVLSILNVGLGIFAALCFISIFCFLSDDAIGGAR